MNATTGNPKKAMTLQDAGAVVFVTPDMIVLASDKTSTIISYPAFDKTVLFTTLILAMGPNNTFVGYETDVSFCLSYDWLTNLGEEGYFKEL